MAKNHAPIASSQMATAWEVALFLSSLRRTDARIAFCCFDTRRLLIRLPNNKFQAWTNSITKILDENSTTHDTLDTLIGQLTHVSNITHPLLHFLSRLRSLKFKLSRRRSVKIEQKHRDDLKIALKILKKANNGISMNLLSFRKPTHCYRADACPWGIGGYNSKGCAWRWELPPKLRW